MVDLRTFLQTRMGEVSQQVALLTSRHAELQAELGRTLEQLAAANAEYSDLTRASQAIGGVGGPSPQWIEPAIETRKRPSMTIKQAVRRVLAAAPGGLTSTQILDQINEQFFDGKIERTSLSPQLSRLRGDGEIDLSNTLWSLSKHIAGIVALEGFEADLGDQKDNESSDEPPSDDSDAEPDEAKDPIADEDPAGSYLAALSTPRPTRR